MNEQYREAIQERYEQFLSEQVAAWEDIWSILQEQQAATESLVGNLYESARLCDFAPQLEQRLRPLFLSPQEQYARHNPMRRALAAVEALDAGVEAMDPDRIGVALHAAVGRATYDGRMQLVLARASLKLREAMILDRPARLASGNGPQTNWTAWRVSLEQLRSEAEMQLSEYTAWAAHVRDHISRPAPHRPEKLRERYRRNLEFWWRRQRAVSAMLDSDARLIRAGLMTMRLTADSVSALTREREDLSLNLSRLHGYIVAWPGGRFEPPQAEARIATIEERVEQWQLRVETEAIALLPEEYETADPRSILPPRRPSWRTQHPRAMMLEMLRTISRPAVESALRAGVESNIRLARELERASEVVMYGIEATREGGSVMLEEALHNARTLLETTRKSLPESMVDNEQAAAESVIRALQRSAAMLEAGRFGLAALVTRHGGWEALRTVKSRSVMAVKAGTPRAVDALETWTDSALVRLGWRVPARESAAPVVRRPGLRSVLDLRMGAQVLPALYRRLFRLTPIEDPRFLVGREAEMRGFQEALLQWRAGEFAACLLVGARGSGKSSLLNCALASVFAEEAIVRAQFSERVTDPLELEQTLSRFLGVEDHETLLRSLSETRRVVILEEIERTFIRGFGGYEALRRLLDLIVATSHNTLWVLSLNDHAFQLLDVAVSLSHYFSHRINAMSVERSDLVKAILQRHNLSGLDLKFAAPKISHHLVAQMRDAFGLLESPQDAFFDAVFKQSGGVFRSAFELWQSSIERVEAGVVVMKQPVDPDFGPLWNELSQLDQFTLHGILEHGSLTSSELATVLMEPVGESERRLSRLKAMNVVEQDPENPGARVRPEAHRFVVELLRRVNLI